MKKKSYSKTKRTSGKKHTTTKKAAKDISIRLQY